MATSLRVVLIVVSLFSLLFIVWKIRNSKMQIEYAIFWIVFSIVMIIMAVFPYTVYWLTTQIGIMSPANFVYLFIIIVLLIKTFMMTIEISKLEDRVKDLVQQIAINEKVEHDRNLKKTEISCLDLVNDMFECERKTEQND